MRGTANPLAKGPFSMIIPDTAGLLGIPSNSGGSLSEDLLPWRIAIDVFQTPVSSVGWTALAVSGNVVYNCYRYTGAQNDEISFDVVMTRGTWSVESNYVANSDAGILTFLLDGVSIGTIDLYGALAYNARSSITGVVIGTTGKYRLTIRGATKNASSSGYNYRLMDVVSTRTA